MALVDSRSCLGEITYPADTRVFPIGVSDMAKIADDSLVLYITLEVKQTSGGGCQA
jgi:hypothetical protein